MIRETRKRVIALVEHDSTSIVSNVRKYFYCLGNSFGESGRCDTQCADCRVYVAISNIKNI